MPTRHTPGAEQVGIIPHFREGESHHGKCGASQLEGARNDLLGDLAFCQVVWGGFKEAGLCCGLDAVKQGSNSMKIYLDKYF